MNKKSNNLNHSSHEQQIDLQTQFHNFLAYCQYQRALSPLSVRGYGFDLLKFSQFLAEQNPPVSTIDLIDKSVLEGYVAFLSPQYMVKTVQRRIAAVRSFFTYLKDQELIEVNPFDKFKLRLKEGKRSPESLTVNEMGRFLKTVYNDEYARDAANYLAFVKNIDRNGAKLKTLEGNFFFARDVAIIELLFAAGLRVAELCNLKFEDYDEIEKSLYIIGKGNRERILYLTNPDALTAFKNYLYIRRAVETNHSFIFITRFRERMSTQAVRNLITKYAGLAGINKNITPHIFRHSFASLLLESGVDIKYIQEFLGHSTITTTQIYLHTSEKEKKRILTENHPRAKVDRTF